MQIAYFVAMSLDGRIAGPGHDLSFLQTLVRRPGRLRLRRVHRRDRRARRGRELLGLHEGLPVDVRRAPDLGAERTADEVPAVEGAEMHVFSGEVADLVSELEAAGLERVWVIGGGDVVGQFLAADRLDELIVTVAPTFRRPRTGARRRRVPAATLHAWSRSSAARVTTASPSGTNGIVR